MYLPEDSNSDEDPQNNQDNNQQEEEEKKDLVHKIDPLASIQSVNSEKPLDNTIKKSDKPSNIISSMNAEITSYEVRMLDGKNNVVFFKV